MEVLFSSQLREDMIRSLQAVLAKRRIVNIPLLAEEIRRRHEAENIALEDIIQQLMVKAQIFDAIMEFDSSEEIFPAAAN